jgi:hypothetical protein
MKDKDTILLENAYKSMYIKEEVEEISDESLSSNEGEKEIKESDSDKIYKIEENIYNKFLEDVKKINKRAAKYKFPMVELQVVDKKELEQYAQRDSGDSRRYPTGRYLTWYFVKVISPPPILDGWEFVARIDHEEFGNIIVKSPQSKYEGNLTQQYGDKPPVCDHCKQIRDRKATFVLEKDGKVQTVGRSCLKYYITGDPYAFIQYAATLSWLLGALLEENGKEDDGFGEDSRGRIRRFNVADSLAYMYQTAKEVGYVSKKREKDSQDEFGNHTIPSTATSFLEMMNDPKRLRRIDTEETIAERKKLGEELLAWGKENIPKMYQKELNEGGKYSDYYGNLLNLLKASESNSTIEEKHIALLASLIGIYFGEQKKEEKIKNNKESNPSKWIGEIGEKLRGFELNVLSIKPWATEYGTSYLVNLQDDNGNNFFWKPTKNPSLDNGDRIKVEVGTVKEHTEYKGIKSTTLLRINFTKIEGGKKEPVDQQQLKPSQTQEKNYLSMEDKGKFWMDFYNTLSDSQKKKLSTTGGGHKLMSLFSNALSNKCTKEEFDKLIEQAREFVNS